MKFTSGRWAMSVLGVLLWGTLGLGLVSTSVPDSAAAGSPGDLLVQKSLAYVRDIKDARLTLSVLQYDPANGREIARMRGKLEVTVDPPALRLQFLEPVALADQLVIVDGDRQEVYVYSPVTEQVIVQPLSQAAGMLGMGLPYAAGAGGSMDIGKLLQIPEAGDEKDYTATWIRDEKWKDTDVGVVDLASGSFPGRQRLWIIRATGQLAQVESYDQQNRLVNRVVIESLQRNIGLQATSLLQLPRGARIMR